MSDLPIDVPSPDRMAKWLRETAENTRARANGQWTGDEIRVAKHVAFRIEQAATQIEQLRGELTLAEEGLANYAQEVEQLRDALDRVRNADSVEETFRIAVEALGSSGHPTGKP